MHHHSTDYSERRILSHSILILSSPYQVITKEKGLPRFKTEISAHKFRNPPGSGEYSSSFWFFLFSFNLLKRFLSKGIIWLMVCWRLKWHLGANQETINSHSLSLSRRVWWAELESGGNRNHSTNPLVSIPHVLRVSYCS